MLLGIEFPIRRLRSEREIGLGLLTGVSRYPVRSRDHIEYGVVFARRLTGREEYRVVVS